MKHLIWNLFLQTGNVETYLLLKSIENEQEIPDEDFIQQEIASYQTKL